MYYIDSYEYGVDVDMFWDKWVSNFGDTEYFSWDWIEFGESAGKDVKRRLSEKWMDAVNTIISDWVTTYQGVMVSSDDYSYDTDVIVECYKVAAKDLAELLDDVTNDYDQEEMVASYEEFGRLAEDMISIRLFQSDPIPRIKTDIENILYEVDRDIME